MKNEKEPKRNDEKNSGTSYRSLNNYDRDAASRASGLACEAGSSLTKQEFKDDCDINVIVQRFGVTGQLPVGLRMPQFGDYDQVDDYRTAIEIVRDAEAQFMRLPGNIRARFQNDPQELLDFCNDKRNLEEARSLGLVPPAEVPKSLDGEGKTS